MAKPINTQSIEKVTGITWDDWTKELDQDGARQLSHADLAKTVYAKLEGKVESPGWWAQGITVAYEQHIGKRVPGQLANGLFEMAVSKTIEVSRSELFASVITWFKQQGKLAGRDYSKPRSSETPKRSNWRCDFADGSKFAATVEEAGDKSKLVLSHTAIPSKQESDEWKQYWRKVADEIASL